MTDHLLSGSLGFLTHPTSSVTSGQSYKASTIVNYDPRVVIWGIFKSGTPLGL